MSMIQDHKAIVADQKAIERWEGEGGRTLAWAAANSHASNQCFSDHVYFEKSDDGGTHLQAPNRPARAPTGEA